ncbi:MAG: hypothetical protein ACLFUR_05315 [Candidatus Hadarchaeia archaeon]
MTTKRKLKNKIDKIEPSESEGPEKIVIHWRNVDGDELLRITNDLKTGESKEEWFDVDF